MAASRFIAAKIRISAQFHHERRSFFYSEKGEKDEIVVLSCLGCLKKTTDVLFIKDNENNLGQLFYQELENLRN